MFSKNKINAKEKKLNAKKEMRNTSSDISSSTPPPRNAQPVAPVKAKPAASIISTDLVIKGNLKTAGNIQVQGTVEGDIRAHLLTISESATVKGEIIADDLVIDGCVIGRVRGLKVRLTSTADVRGDIIHKTIAIESGARFEGSVTRQDDPLNSSVTKTEKPTIK